MSVKKFAIEILVWIQSGKKNNKKENDEEDPKKK